MFQPSNVQTEDLLHDNGLPKQMNLTLLKDKGAFSSGYDLLANMSQAPSNDFIEEVAQIDNTDELYQNEDQNSSDHAQPVLGDERTPTQTEIANILLTRVQARRRSFKEITGNSQNIDVLDANGSSRSIIDWAHKANLDNEQQRAFQIFASSFVLTYHSDADDYNEDMPHSNNSTLRRERRKLKYLADQNRRQSKQLIALLHGLAGSGKTTVFDLLILYAKEYTSLFENYEFTSRTIVITAMTGVAATILLGETAHSAMYLSQTRDLEQEQYERWEHTRLLIVDEILFASESEVSEMHNKLSRLKQNIPLPFGGLDIVFAGDFRQLEPVGKEGKQPLYETSSIEFKSWINCFIELEGMHRFKNDLPWGWLLRRFRDGVATADDIDTINQHLVSSGNDSDLPNSIRYATYFNKDRDAINAALLFEKRCKSLFAEGGSTKDSFMIFSDNIQVRNCKKVYQNLLNRKLFWETCGESDIQTSRSSGRMDPVLRLYKGCPVMLPTNTCVSKGQANGTQATVEKIVLKPGKHPELIFIAGNMPVRSVLASEVDHIVLSHCSDRILPSTFSVKSKQFCFKTKLPKGCFMMIAKLSK